jgi:hypothetical protein
MAISVSAGSGTTFQPAPAGVHQAVCVDVVDLGIIEVTWQGKTKKQHKVKVVWQINEARDDGKPFLVQKRYTASLHEKAGLRKDLESWRGRAFTEDELRGFDLEALLGANCLVNVMHAERGGETYANVAAVMALPKGMPKIAGRDYVRVVDREPQQAHAHEDAPHPAESGGMDLDDDSIPF